MLDYARYPKVGKKLHNREQEPKTYAIRSFKTQKLETQIQGRGESKEIAGKKPRLNSRVALNIVPKQSVIGLKLYL